MYRALTGKKLVFWIGGCLRDVVTHGGSTVLPKVWKQTQPSELCLWG